MRRKIVVSIALVLSIAAVALMSSDSTASAQRNRSYLYDSGVVRLGPNQVLIGLLIPGIQDNQVPVRSTKMQYAEVSCNGSVCKDQIASQNIFEDVILSSVVLRDSITQLPISSGVRIVFSSNNPNLRANGQIIDTVSGAVVSTFSFGASQVGN